jgi:hypothetical protein
MSAEEKLTQRIIKSGLNGIKKTDLRREFAGQDIDAQLENIISRGDVYIDKKAAAYYCWYKDYYVQNLLNSDLKFRLVFDSIKDLERVINESSEAYARKVETTTHEVISSLLKLNTHNGKGSDSELALNGNTALQLDEFKCDFDNSISNYSNSIGWVELAKVRNQMRSKYNIAEDEFYRLVEKLVINYNANYELSTGGDEGITIRGLLHGFVRCT